MSSDNLDEKSIASTESWTLVKDNEESLELIAPTITVTATKGCPYRCGKVGVPILPVVFSSIDYNLTSQDQRYFAHSLTSKVTNNSAIASLPTNAYLYCYEKDIYNDSLKVSEYYTGEDGALKRTNVYHPQDLTEIAESNEKISLRNLEESDTEIDTTFNGDKQPFNCTRPEHNTLDSKYITVEFGVTLWLMVSHAELSKSILKKYFEDEKLRDKRMQKFVYSELNNNDNTVNMSEAEVSYIKSFHRRRQLNNAEEISSSIQARESTSVSTVEYGSNEVANALYQRMHNNTAEKIEDLEKYVSDGQGDEYDKNELTFLKKAKPMMVALPDPVGEVLAAAEKRNYLLKQLDDKQKSNGDVRKQINAIIIDNIKTSIERSNQPSQNERIAYGRAGLGGNHKQTSAVGQNIYQYINRSSFESVLSSAKKSRQDKAAIAAARQTFIDAIKRPEFAFVMREDFPENDEESHLGYAQIIAEAIQGIGIDESNIGIPDAIWADHQPEQVSGMTAKQEFEQTLLPCLSGEKPPEDNWLSKALIGLNPEDNQKMQDAPTYENLARASDFIGTATNWLNTFKNEAKQKAIDAKTAQKIQYLNELASYKAQIVQTMSNNMSHIKENNRWLYKMDLWTQASVNQSTGFRLAQKILKYSPDKATKLLEGFLNNRINNAKPHKTLIPASIDTGAVKQVSGSSVPFAVDFMHSLGVDQQALDIYNNAATGDKNARMTVTLYTDKATAQAAASVNQSLADAQTDLNKYVDSHSGAQRQLERSSAGKAALISAGIGLFQLRSVWMGRSSLNAMAARGDLIAREFMTSYASTSLALTGAALDVAAASIQIRGASTTAIARLSLSVGVLGAVGAGFEVYSLLISRERHVENRSSVSERATNIAIGSAFTAGVSGAAIALGFTMPWVVGILAVAWGVSLIAQWVAFRYDKGHILPIHYWLDAGVFGNKAMLNSEYPNNPFKIQAMGSIEQDMHAYSLALTEIQVNPQFATNTTNFRQTLSGQIEITLSQWNDDSELVVEFIGIGNQELGLDRKSFNIETLKRQNKAMITGAGLQVTLDIPKTSHFQAQYLGSYMEGTRDPNKERNMQEARERAQANAGREVDKLRAVVKYALNPSMNPYYQLRTSVTSQ